MSEPLGEERIVIRADATAFRAEVEAQVRAALASVRTQAAAIPLTLPRVAQAVPTRAGLALPAAAAASTQQATRALQQVTGVQREMAAATAVTQTRLAGLTAANQRVVTSSRGLSRSVQRAETDLGRLTRGTVAATAASTGLFRAVSFASGAFLIGAVAGGALAAALREFGESTRVVAQTEALIRATGGAAQVSAEQVRELAGEMQSLTGISDELVQQSANVLLTFRGISDQGEGMNAIFTRSVRATADIAAIFRTDLRSAAVQLGKALQDPVVGVTALRRAGITLSQSQRDLIKSLVETGQTLKAQRLILSEIEQQVGGTASAVGRTLPGRLNVLRERAKDALGEYVARLSESHDAAVIAAQGAQVLSAAWRGLKEAVATIGPPLVQAAQGLGRVTEAVGGAGVLLAAAAAYKGISVAARAAAAAQTVFAAASAGAASATLAQAAASGAATAALTSQAAAETAAAAAAQRTLGRLTAVAGVFALGAAASGQFTLAAGAGALALAGIGSKALAAARSLRAAGQAVTFARVATAALGGPLGIAALGVGALTVGLLLLRSRAENAAGSINALRDALGPLNEALAEQTRLRGEVAATGERATEARLEEQAARRSLEAARARLQASRADPGSLERRALADQVAQAETRLRQAIGARLTAERQATLAVAQAREQERDRRAAVGQTTQGILENIRALQGRALAEAAGVFGVTTARGPEQVAAQARQQALEEFLTLTGQLQESAFQADRTIGAALASIGRELDAIPPQKTIDVVVELAGARRSVRAILDQLGFREIEAIRADNWRAIQGHAEGTAIALQEQFRAARTLLRTEEARLKTSKERFAAAEREAEQARDNLATARESVRVAQEALAAARQALADTISSARQAVNDAVRDAKANLRSIADALADALGKITGAGDRISPELQRRFQELREQIIRGAGGPETRRAAQEVAALATAERDRGGDRTDEARRRLADLTDQFNRGRISASSFNRRLDRLLEDFQFDSAAFAREFGMAARNELLDQIRALRQQAAAVAEGPQRAGGGTAPEIVRPLETVAQTNRDIADAQRQVRDSVRDLAQASQRLAEAQLEEQKASKRQLTRQTFLLEAINRRDAAQARLRRAEAIRPKPQGSGSEQVAETVSPRSGR